MFEEDIFNTHANDLSTLSDIDKHILSKGILKRIAIRSIETNCTIRKLANNTENNEINLRTIIDKFNNMEQVLYMTIKKISDLHQKITSINNKLNRIEDALGYLPESDNYELVKEHFESLNLT